MAIKTHEGQTRAHELGAVREPIRDYRGPLGLIGVHRLIWAGSFGALDSSLMTSLGMGCLEVVCFRVSAICLQWSRELGVGGCCQ